MKARAVTLLLLASLLFVACEKNTTSKIPHIALMAFAPQDSMTINTDTAIIEFSIVDGDADIGNDSVSQIYLKDSRYEDLGFVKTPFPAIDATVEDPKKGLQGTCIFIPLPQPTPRPDSLHTALVRDTLSYELYVTDRANHQSNHIITHSFIIRK